MRRFSTALWILLLLLGRGAAMPAGDPRQEKIRFNRDIRPILAENCFLCHGPDPGSRKAKLRLDREEGFFGQREGGPTVVKGKPEASPLYQRLVNPDKDEVMPPPKSKKSLKPAERDLIKRWIEQGAPWEPHWSLIKPERPALPAVKDERWVRNPVDRFILARHRRRGDHPRRQLRPARRARELRPPHRPHGAGGRGGRGDHLLLS